MHRRIFEIGFIRSTLSKSRPNKGTHYPRLPAILAQLVMLAQPVILAQPVTLIQPEID